MAHPRQTALTTMARILSESVVGSMASARPLDVHSAKTRRMSGAKAGADVCPVRRRRGAVGPVADPLAETLPDGGESAREGRGGDDGVLASAFGGYGSERWRASPLDCASARFGMVCRRVWRIWRHSDGKRAANLRRLCGFLLPTKMPESRALSKSARSSQGKPAPISP